VRRLGAAALALLLATAARAAAHDGPPFPIVSEQRAGAYEISIWTDPDVTDDATPGGQFWVIVHTAARQAVPRKTKVRVAVRPTNVAGAEGRAEAAPSPQDPSRYFAALRLDHEGRWNVSATIEGPLGPAETRADVEATYDARPAPAMLLVYLMPFVLVGLLWLKALRHGRTARRPPRQ
jgi:hypothetical protein